MSDLYEDTPETVDDLLNHVQDTDSDFHDGIGGYLNFEVVTDLDGVDVLRVSFDKADGSEILEGYWKLYQCHDPA